MKLFVEVEKYLTFQMVTYYTIRKRGDILSETEKFFQRFVGTAYEKDLGNLRYWLEDKIGKERGATERYFRAENKAHALPPPIPSSDLRLYCYRCNDSVVILGNGGVKESKKVKDSPDCYPHFQFINEVVNELKRRKIDCNKLPNYPNTLQLTLNIESP